MAQDRPEFADKLRDALQLKKAGNAIVDLVGGRAIHPINVRLGGFYRSPGKSDLANLAEQLRRSQDITRDLVRWTASLDFPPFEHDYEFVALRHESEYPMNDGRLVSNRGLDIAMDDFPEQFEEYQVPYSNALQCRRKGGGAYFVGPLARWNLCADEAGTEIQQLARETGIAWPCRNPYVSIVARALETAYAVDEALRLIAAYRHARGPRHYASIPCRLRRVDHRGPARHSLPPIRGRRERPRDARHHHPPHQPEPASDRGRPDPFRPVGAGLARRPGCLAVRAGRAKL